MLPGRRALLVVAHPGHELRVHGWLELARPVVCVLTDGSGHAAGSRLPSTTAVVRHAGAAPGSIYGRLTDRALYAAVLAGDAEPFARLAEELADVVVRERIDHVVGDALEGYNPAHDLCRVLIEAAVALAGDGMPSLDFPLTGPPDAYTDGTAALALTLDDAAFARKRAAAAAYPELAGEVRAAVGAETAGAFQRECLRAVPAGAALGAPPSDPPYYETYGERQVAAGRYAAVLRWRAHLAPLVRALRARLRLP
jgi:hypothetical protein